MGESDIQQECRKLQETAQALEANWLVEMTAYELLSRTNKPNDFGTVTEETLFPYTNALYPLLDCFDGLIDKYGTAGPAPLPLPYTPYNGHRRKRSRPTIDHHGAQILELTMLEGHLPNSAWAIRQAIMPHERHEQFANESESKGKAQNVEEQQQQHPPVLEVNDGQMHPNPRFFNILMDPSSEFTHIASSNISIPPLNGDDDGNSDWEDIDEDFDEDNVNDDEIDVYSNGNLARNFTFLFWWEQKITSERKGISFPSTCTSQKSSIPSSAVLLKVLMHSLSELQSDHRLARAVLLRLADCKACSFDESTNIEDALEHENEFECLRQLLSVLSLGCTPCDGYCHETYITHEHAGDLLDDSLNINPPNHYCQDIWELYGSVSTLFAYGIENMTQQHASIICAFFIRELDIDSVESETANNSHQKAYLKKNIQYFHNDIANERDDDEEDPSFSATHVHLLSAVLNGIRLHAVSDRMRLDSLQDSVIESTDDDVARSVRQASQSYKTCVDILVDIGERILLRLPTNWHNRQLGGMVIRGLLEACMDNTMKSSDSSYYMAHNEGTLRSAIDPLRYADAVRMARTHPLVAPSNNKKNKRATSDVHDVVKGLFRRDLVDLYVSGCGYGDFVCWCNLPIFPEPLLFDYITNFPQDNEDEEPPQQYEWFQDNDGLEVDYPHLVACYDFSLLMLLREWNKPWTPQSHLSFSIPHRQAISSLALCAHRFGVPASIVEIVNSFLPRAWWHDERLHCWCRECQLKQLAAAYRKKISLRTNNWNGVALPQYDSTTQSRPRKPMTTCTCGVVSVCSKDHLKRLQREGHKRQCGLPPFRPPFGKEENIFVREIFGANDESIDDNEARQAETDDVEEDEDSWESVASNEEDIHITTMRDKIYAWFNDRSYKIQRREAPTLPFANFM